MGHGHVTPNPDGSRERCGGPGICAECSREAAADWRIAAGVPRRACLDKCTPAELAIMTAIAEVEKVGADPRLTEAVILLGRARDQVADYIDGLGSYERPAPTAMPGEPERRD